MFLSIILFLKYEKTNATYLQNLLIEHFYGIIVLCEDSQYFLGGFIMEEWNGKKVNFKRIYSQIVKFGATVPELAKEYEMEEQAFVEMIEKNFDQKVFSTLVKANKRKLKKKRSNKEMLSAKPVVKKSQEREEENKKNNVFETSLDSILNGVKALDKVKEGIIAEISREEKTLNKATQILKVCKESVAEKQRNFDKAKEALKVAQKEQDRANEVAEKHFQFIEKLKSELNGIDIHINELKEKVIYLVAPGYMGEKPEFGTFYSTTMVEGYDSLSVVEISEDYTIEPEIKDMLIAGYDSLNDYIKALRFVMLCMEYTLNDIEYTVLVDDERVKSLLKKYVE